MYYIYMTNAMTNAGFLQKRRTFLANYDDL